jgi:hypothetical protein
MPMKYGSEPVSPGPAARPYIPSEEPALGLPTATFGLAAPGELDAEQARPELPRSLRIMPGTRLGRTARGRTAAKLLSSTPSPAASG